MLFGYRLMSSLEMTVIRRNFPLRPLFAAGLRFVMLATLAVSLAKTASAAPPTVDAGEWRMTWHQQSIKGPQGIPLRFLELQTLTDNVCLSRVPALPLPPGLVSGCEINLESAVAETITWRGTCRNNAQVAGQIRYHGAAIEGTVNIETDGVSLGYQVKGSRRRPACE
jgi:hypothetical protein